jgi:hypothetical protein
MLRFNSATQAYLCFLQATHIRTGQPALSL